MRHVILAAALLVPPVVNAASFDCARARLADERAICADRALNDQDVRMEVLLSVNGRFHLMGANGAMHDDQRAWLAERHGCGANRACLARAYKARIDQLNTGVDAVSQRMR